MHSMHICVDDGDDVLEYSELAPLLFFLVPGRRTRTVICYHPSACQQHRSLFHCHQEEETEQPLQKLQRTWALLKKTASLKRFGIVLVVAIVVLHVWYGAARGEVHMVGRLLAHATEGNIEC